VQACKQAIADDGRPTVPTTPNVHAHIHRRLGLPGGVACQGQCDSVRIRPPRPPAPHRSLNSPSTILFAHTNPHTHCQAFLEAGYTVRATVRDPDAHERLRVLKALPGANERLTFWRADLLEPGSFDAAIEGGWVRALGCGCQRSIHSTIHPPPQHNTQQSNKQNTHTHTPYHKTKQNKQAPPTSCTRRRPWRWRWCRTRRSSWCAPRWRAPRTSSTRSSSRVSACLNLCVCWSGRIATHGVMWIARDVLSFRRV
jgi:hypothetical protein